MKQGFVNFMVKKNTTIKIGVIGVGHLGNSHLKQLKGIPHISISGLYDIDQKRADKMSLFHDVHSYSSLDEILDKIIYLHFILSNTSNKTILSTPPEIASKILLGTLA